MIEKIAAYAVYKIKIFFKNSIEAKHPIILFIRKII
jgi:hypothetical protein